jgi:hypothetical protein
MAAFFAPGDGRVEPAAQTGQSADPKTAAALRFALQVVENRAHVALNLFTNDVNVTFDVPVDFPAVKLRLSA